MKMDLDLAGEAGREIIERDRAALSPSYTREYALVVDHAQGSEVWDVDGWPRNYKALRPCRIRKCTLVTRVRKR
jgi:hypothetical protein